MAAVLHGLVTFATAGSRTAARNRIEQWINDWNETNPGAPLTGSVAQVTYLYPADDADHPGESARALLVDYTCPSYQVVEAAQQGIADGLGTGGYQDVVVSATWWVP